ncbi:hypothetical protein MM188_003195 [Vibrio cholerae]|nr:hypothetical protein [Vibrio cholerae]
MEAKLTEMQETIANQQQAIESALEYLVMISLGQVDEHAKHRVEMAITHLERTVHGVKHEIPMP